MHSAAPNAVDVGDLRIALEGQLEVIERAHAHWVSALSVLESRSWALDCGPLALRDPASEARLDEALRQTKRRLGQLELGPDALPLLAQLETAKATVRERALERLRDLQLRVDGHDQGDVWAVLARLAREVPLGDYTFTTVRPMVDFGKTIAALLTLVIPGALLLRGGRDPVPAVALFCIGSMLWLFQRSTPRNARVLVSKTSIRVEGPSALHWPMADLVSLYVEPSGRLTLLNRSGDERTFAFAEDTAALVATLESLGVQRVSADS